MISCENSSLVFGGAERLHTAAITKSTAVSSHSTAAVIFAAVPTVATLSSAQSTLLAYNHGDSANYTECYSHDNNSRSGGATVAKEEQLTFVTSSNLHVDTKNRVLCVDFSAVEADTAKEISSNDVPTPATSCATTEIYEETGEEETAKLTLALCEEKEKNEKDIEEREEDGKKGHKLFFLQNSFQPAFLNNEKQSSFNFPSPSFCDGDYYDDGDCDGDDNTAVCAVKKEKREEKEEEEGVNTKSDLFFSPVSVGKLLEPKINGEKAYLAVTLFLENLCYDNEEEPVLTSDFHSHRIPSMSVESYVDRIVRYSHIGGETLIVSLMLLLKYSHFIEHPVSIYNVHRLLITSALLGAKLRDDMYYSNEYYSRIGGITNFEINKLELRFCTLLEWDMWIDEIEYETFESLLIRLVEKGNLIDKDRNAVSRKSFERQFWVNYLLPWKKKFELSCTLRRNYIRESVEAYLSNEYVHNNNNKCVKTSRKGFSFSFTGNSTGLHERIGGFSLEEVMLPKVLTRVSTGLTERDQHQQWGNCGGVFDGNVSRHNNNNNNSGKEFGIMGRAVHSTSTFTTTTTTATTTNNNNNKIATSTMGVSGVVSSINANSYYYGGGKSTNITNTVTSRDDESNTTAVTLCEVTENNFCNPKVAVNYEANNNNTTTTITDNNNNKVKEGTTTTNNNNNDVIASSGNILCCGDLFHTVNNNNNNNLTSSAAGGVNINFTTKWHEAPVNNNNNMHSTHGNNPARRSFIFSPSSSSGGGCCFVPTAAVGGAATHTTRPPPPPPTRQGKKKGGGIVLFSGGGGGCEGPSAAQRAGVKRQKPDHYRDCR